MLYQFLTYLKERNLIGTEDKFLLSVSGGKDSMVMAHLFLKAGLIHGIAHIDHQTRGMQHEKEISMLQQYCTQHSLDFHLTKLPIHQVNQSNFQANARDFRYNFLQKTAVQNGYSKIATAHHTQDNVESFFLNLFRSAGMRGLSGIAPVKDNIIRPLLFAQRKDIDEYQEVNHIQFCEDPSNESDKYLRNKIRIHLLPVLTEIDENALNAIDTSIKHIAESSSLLDFLIKEKLNTLVETNEEYITIDLISLKELPGSETIFWYFLQQYGFSKEAILDLYNSQRAGAEIISDTHQAIQDRDQIIIRPKSLDKQSAKLEIVCSEPGEYKLPWGGKFLITLENHLELGRKNEVEYLGFEEDPFPIKIRERHQGDVFKPLGLKGKTQKVKDFITNSKLDYIAKSKLTIFEKNDEICYVAPYRISEKYRVKERSKHLLRIEYQET